MIILKEKKEQFISNLDYANWLVDFTKKGHSSVSTDDINQMKDINEEDVTKLRELKYFIEALADYIRENKIYANFRNNQKNPERTYFIITINDNIFELSFGSDKYSFKYIESMERDGWILNLNKIVNIKQLQKPDASKKILVDLKEMLTNLKELNVSKKDINTIVNEVFPSSRTKRQ